MQNEAKKPDDDLQNEKRLPQKTTKTPGFFDKDSSTKDEQEPAVKQPQKALKVPKFVDTGSITEDGQEPAVRLPQKAPKLQSLLIQARVLRMNKSLQ